MPRQIITADFCSGGLSPGSPDESSRNIISMTQADNADLQDMYNYWVDGVSELLAVAIISRI